MVILPFLVSIVLIIVAYDQKIKIDYSLVIIIVGASALASFSYYWNPLERFDLYRYRWMVDVFHKGNLLDSIKYLFSRGEYLTMLYFFILSYFSDRAIIQVLPTFVTYLLLFLSLKNTLFNRNSVGILGVLLLLYLMANFKYLDVISGVRFFFSVAIFVWIFILIQNEDIKEIYILLPVLFHTSMILFVVLYFVSKLPIKKSMISLVILLVSFLLLRIILFYSGIEHIEGNGLFNTYLLKFITYFKISWTVNNQVILYLVELLFTAYIINDYFRANEFMSTPDKFIILLFLCSFFTSWNLVFSMRLFTVVRIMIIPYTFSVIKRKKIKNLVSYNSLLLLLVLMTVSGFYVQYRIFIIDILPNLVF